MNPQDNKGASSGSSGGVLKSMFTGIIYFFAILAALVVKPAQALTKSAYRNSGFGTFALGAGIILSIIGSIGTGYLLHQHGAPVQWWLSAAVAAPFAVYYYLWPLAFLGIGKWTFRFSSFLWRNVHELTERYESHSTRGPAWFSILLSVVLTITAVISCLYLFWHCAVGIHDFLAWNNFFAWIFGVVGGGLVAWLAGMVVISAIWKAGMPAVALFTGAALVYFYGYDLSTLVPWFNHAIVRHIGEALQVALWVAYIFPLLHILISRLFGWVGTLLDKIFEHIIKRFFDFVAKYWGKLLDATYNDDDKAYLGLLRQSAAIAAAVYVGFHAFGYTLPFGFGFWLAVPAGAFAALIAYLIGGFTFRSVTPMVIGVFSSIGAALLGFYLSHHVFHLLGGNPVAAAGVGAVSVLANAFLVYPVVYVLVRLIAKPLLASWLGLPLTELYRTISTEVFNSIDETYDEDSAYLPFFVQAVNIAVAFGVYFLAGQFVGAIHLHGFWALALPVALVAFSYLLIGRLLVAYNTVLIGTLTSIAAGAFVGVEVFVHFDHNFWYAVPSFIVGALAFGFAFFPVAYVVLRAGLELLAFSRWAAPALSAVYNFFFSYIIAKGWAEFVAVYRRVAFSFAPIWANVSKTWDEAWASAKETFEKAFNSKK